MNTSDFPKNFAHPITVARTSHSLRSLALYHFTFLFRLIVYKKVYIIQYNEIQYNSDAKYAGNTKATHNSILISSCKFLTWLSLFSKLFDFQASLWQTLHEFQRPLTQSPALRQFEPVSRETAYCWEGRFGEAMLRMTESFRPRDFVGSQAKI